MNSEAVTSDSQSPPLRYEVLIRLLRMCARLQATGAFSRTVPFVQRLPSIIPVTVPAVARFLAESNCTPKQVTNTEQVLLVLTFFTALHVFPFSILRYGSRFMRRSAAVS